MEYLESAPVELGFKISDSDLSKSLGSRKGQGMHRSPLYHRLSRSFVLAFNLSFLACVLHVSMASEWPDWRGPNFNNTSPESEFPTEWDAQTHVRWKVALPDRGNSSPIVSGSRVIITQATEKEQRREVMVFDRTQGNLLWHQGVVYAEKESTHPQNPYCAASPSTDGERIFATFGSAGAYAYDMEGKELWHRDLGPQVHIWGNASSPVLQGDLCYLYHGPGPGSYVIALNKQTGETVWRFDEPAIDETGRTDGFRGQEGGITGSFSTLLPFSHQGRKSLLMSFPNQLIALDPASGKRVWWAHGMNPLIYASAIEGEGIAVGMGGYFGSTIGVRLGGQGDVTDSHRLWQNVRDSSRIGSGVVHQGHIYVFNSDGMAQCMELKTGKTVWEERVRGKGPKSESWSTMIRAGDRLYCLNQSADMIVLRAAPEFELIAVNALKNERTNSTHAMSHGEIFIRTWENLWCISNDRSIAQAH